MKRTILILLLLLQNLGWSQSSINAIQKAIASKKQLEEQSLFKEVVFESVGPTIMSGRVVDLDVNPNNPIEFYVAYASGGLWYTKNNGTSFEPVMDTATTLNCGSLSVDWATGTLWVGTGEVNSSRSSYSGIGILKSTDKGKTWENIGLHDSHHISKIIVNPKNLNEIIVSVIGHLYTKNNERGVFKTTDGGKTWKQTLFISDDVGVIDMVVASDDFNVLYATSWQRDRKAFNFNGNGIGSGIYKSTDAGTTWQLISTKVSGFPNDEFVGRIGISAFTDAIIYATMDNQKKKPSEKKAEKPKDANAALVETDVIGAEIYKSIDGGKTWKKANDNYINNFYNSYGYYFGDITVDKKNQDRIYVTGVPLLFSDNGGKTFTSIDGDNVHSDHHVVWINPNNPEHIINGNDGGINITYDNGKHWILCNSNPVGQFYAINVDEQEPYNIYGGLQDNGVWVGSNDYKYSAGWYQEGKYPYQRLIGGDGMQIQIDKRNPNIVFTGYQYGNYFKVDRTKDKDVAITPKPLKEEKSFRFNWQTPILLSSHNQDILYLGSNFLHRSMNQGETWTAISPDLTQGKKEGNVAFGTITTISESPFQFGLLYIGTDDGLLNVTKDGGATWNKISTNLPQDLWVSRVVASAYKKERVYAALNGYRNDDFTTYIYVSNDFGQTWQSITNNLPSSPINVIIEDSINEDILYVGTDNGLYVSLDRGATWDDFSAGIPTVAVHDLVIQKKAKDLIVGTHGRSIYKVNLEQIQQLKKEVLAKDLSVFEVKKRIKSKQWGSRWNDWSETIEPKVEIWFYSNSDSEVNLQIENPLKGIVFIQDIKAKKGLNKYIYDLSLSKEAADKWKSKDKNLKIEIAKNGKYYLPVSKYKISIQKGKEKVVTDFEITESKEKENKDLD
jgi:photosystem II stability/assembly factor-like uncharacterized protein